MRFLANDNTAVGLAIPYFILIILTWITAGSFTTTYPYHPWLYGTQGAIFIFVGCLLLIPVFILTIIFLATNDDSCEKVAFGLGFPGLLLIVSGTIVTFYYTIDSFLNPTLLLVFVLPQVILAFGLYARRTSAGVNMRPSSSRQRIYPYQANPRRVPGGRVTIPNEVRMASTHGQTLKKCVRCGNTLDLRTRVCYFCGARQSSGPARPISPITPPAERPSIYQRVHTSTPASTPAPMPGQGLNYCPNCGARIIPGHLFCTQCGASLD